MYFSIHDHTDKQTDRHMHTHTFIYRERAIHLFIHMHTPLNHIFSPLKMAKTHTNRLESDHLLHPPELQSLKPSEVNPFFLFIMKTDTLCTLGYLDLTIIHQL